MGDAEEVLDLAEVRAYTVSKGLVEPGSTTPVSAPEIRLFLSQKPWEDAARERRERERREREEMWAEAEKVREAAVEFREHKRRAREWGRENGFFVGTRGRIPAAVWQGYQESIGRKL